jgi:AcrR family transcriptional regulator
VPLVTPSTKEQIVRVAERLFAERGLDGVSLRQIGAEAGNGNHSAVQYHFGSKEELVEAIFAFRLPHVAERRRILAAHRRPTDLRSCVECYVLPILEQGEERGSYYLSFVAMLQQSGDRDLLDRIPEQSRASTAEFRQQMETMLADLPEPLRSHRLGQALTFSIHASADRQRQQAAGLNVLPFAVHVSDLLDGLIGFLTAPVSPAALAALDDEGLEGGAPPALAWSVLL